MDVATFDQLRTQAGRAALEAAAELTPTDTKYPACFDRLRKHVSSDLARAALDTVMLRARARSKFVRADEMFFTREALEMASGEAVSRHRAGRYAGFTAVVDLCCGVGGDAIGLAATGVGVTAVDRDPLRLRMAEANLAAYGLGGRFVCGDVLGIDLADIPAAFADPGRRPEGRRTLALDRYEPPLSGLRARFASGFPWGVKVAPGLPREEFAGLNADPEFVSVGGELKECVLWFGLLRTGLPRATVLPGPHILTGDPSTMVPVGSMGGFLYDPDPAVTRSGLVGTLAGRLGAWSIDPRIAFMSSNALTPTPFAAAYRVEEVLPFHVQRVGEWLRARSVGRVTVVKRGSAADVVEVVRKWKLRGDVHRTVILTRALDRPVAVIGERV